MEKSSLIDLFGVEDQQLLKSNNKVLLIDGHNVAYRTLFSAVYMNPEDNNKFHFWRHLFVNSLFNSIQAFKPTKVVLAFDTKPSWRYSIYEDYKANRKEARDKAVVDFEKFFPIFNEFITSFKETFTKIYVLQVERAEGDDIIAVLSKDVFNKNQENIIVSNDSDLHQLINKNIKQYDPLKKKMVECLNPQKELDIKILTGDKTDNIPPVKLKTGGVTAEKILSRGLELFLNESEEIKQNYLRNKQLIDLNFIPQNIKENIINMYNDYKISEMSGQKIMDFFVFNKLNKLMENWGSISDSIKSLE